MKRYGHLYEQVISIANLQLADEKARRGKRDSYGVRLHDRDRWNNILRLHDMLHRREFRTSPYRTFKVYEPKERLIYRLPYYPDRIVHHAIMNVLEPIWMRIFPHNIYSCIIGRGIDGKHGCTKRVDKIISRYREQDTDLYCLKIDIRKFYPSVDHEVLKRTIRRSIKDKDLLCLIGDIIDSSDGLPIGSYPSQSMANLLLAYFMHTMTCKHGAECVAYADDIVFFSDNKRKLHELKTDVYDLLSETYHLTMKSNWQVFRIAKNRSDNHARPLDFIGYRFYIGQKLLRRKSKQHLCMAVKKLYRCRYPPTISEIVKSISPWLGWAQHSNSSHLLKTILKSTDYKQLQQKYCNEKNRL